MSEKSKLIMDRLLSGWMTVPDLLLQTGWKSHTLRSFLSQQGKEQKIKVERSRANGITSYRALAILNEPTE